MARVVDLLTTQSLEELLSKASFKARAIVASSKGSMCMNIQASSRKARKVARVLRSTSSLLTMVISRMIKKMAREP